MKKILYFFFGLLGVCLLLLITDTKVLVYEYEGPPYTDFDPTRTYLKKMRTFDCKYFTGIKFVTRNTTRDYCRFLVRG